MRPTSVSPRRPSTGPAGSLALLAVVTVVLAGCGSSGSSGTPTAGSPTTAGPAPTSAPATTVAPSPSASVGMGGRRATPTPTRPAGGVLRAGNPDGGASVPAAARAVDVSRPTRVVGTGTPASCTSAAVVRAVAAGGIITFDCGPDPVTIRMLATAKVHNANGPKVVLDGGGKVTLSGGGTRRILYQNTCDQAQGWTTSTCQNQDHPQLTVQNITFADGNSTGETAEGGGGGAIFVRGGRFKVVNARFVDNRCDRTGPDLGGAAVRVLSQHDNQPVYVVNSTFTGGRCANGGALSSIGVSWSILNSVFRDNRAVGAGANPARSGTPGGGSGGAVYCDGNRFTVRLAGSIVEDNRANEGGGAVFFVSNDRTGTMTIEKSTLRGNPSAGFETRGYPGIFFLGARNPTVTGSRLS
ncbi:hypothetical protein [Micromonospora cathayae]|uniref:Polymorphic outer membrane protein repeat-containing protein n=1 Tax=Micromonospora cathayae TaxID=3028804 RepID=A0ABY7ZTM4_9ACTN|nr:hypothetical protein [Micromonospora sp. HUAS 3]WDZ86250.1 hypothetical protein PVK37_07540 [Micromonospora sp. HUAS 3]